MAKLSVEQALTKAKSHIKKGEVAEAQTLYATILKAFPNNKKAQQGLTALGGSQGSAAEQGPPQAVINQLMSLYKQGQLELVVDQAQDLTVQFPEAVAVWNILGASAAQIGKLDQAINAFREIIVLNPNQASSHYNLGNALKDQGKLEEAIEAYAKTLELKPDYEAAQNNLRVALIHQSEFSGSRDRDEIAVSTTDELPNSAQANADAHFQQGQVYYIFSKLGEAIESYNKALLSKPNFPAAYFNMGLALYHQGKLEEAIKAYKKSLSLKSDYAEAYGLMGIAFADQGKPEEAIEAYTKSLSLDPDNAEAYRNMGIALKDQGKLEEAIEAYNKALAIKPDYAEAHMNLSFLLLNTNRLPDGFTEYEWRWKTKKELKSKRYFSQPLWNGKTSLKGKRILLWSEQGVGDTINWSYCLPFIASEAEHCILECQEKLVPLLTRSFPNVEVKCENRSLDSERDDFDLHLPMGSLFRHCITKLPLDFKVDAYLVPDPGRVNFWIKRLHSIGKGPYVGISWKSANMNPSRISNYASISDLLPILTLPNITLINLQYTDFEDDLAKIQKNFGVKVHNFDDLDHYNNLDEVAALSLALDVVVSVQSAVPIITAGVGTCTKLAGWRQSSFNSILNSPLGPSFDKFLRNTWEPWDETFSLIAEGIVELSDLKS
ncbi:tetratricopeptide repeat protein [bacterium]|nr:tetratricopeptide repeat protein [Planktomarina temperata]MDC1036124.1 tetratricopeptide repeat protein [bacterium]